MPFIICDTNFNDGKDRYFGGERRLVSDERAAYFSAHCWAHADGEHAVAPDPQPEAVVTPHDSIHPNGG